MLILRLRICKNLSVKRLLGVIDYLIIRIDPAIKRQVITCRTLAKRTGNLVRFCLRDFRTCRLDRYIAIQHSHLARNP